MMDLTDYIQCHLLGILLNALWWHSRIHILEKRNWCRVNGFYRNSNLLDVSSHFAFCRLNCWCRDKMGDNKTQNDKRKEKNTHNHYGILAFENWLHSSSWYHFQFAFFLLHTNFSQQKSMISIWSDFLFKTGN